MMRISLLAIVAWVVPETNWPSTIRLLKKMGLGNRTYHRQKKQDRVDQINQVIGELDRNGESDEIQYQPDFSDYQTSMQLLREYRPGGWRPVINVCGLEHIEAGVKKGCGVILWVGEFASSSLVTKMGLYQAGYSVYHLSRPTHGFSRTCFGVRYLNPFWTRIEDRYIKKRITIKSNDSANAKKALIQCLHNNRVVSITVGAEAKRTIDLPFFRARLRLATGPVNLALTEMAPLLPVFTIRKSNRKFEIVICPPLNVDTNADKSLTIATAAK